MMIILLSFEFIIVIPELRNGMLILGKNSMNKFF